MKKQFLGLIAVIVAIGASAFTTPIHHFTNVKWRPNYNGLGQITSWTNVDNLQQGHDYTCDPGSEVCTAEFPAGITPTASTPVPTDHVNGDFD